MFRRMSACVMVLCVTVALSSAACHGKDKGKPPETASPFELTPPPGYRPVTAPLPLLGAWEAPRLPNGFTPTLNVARQPLPAGTPDQIYATWRDELMAVLKKQFQEVKVLAERPLPAGERTGKLIIAVGTLPIPGGKTPMPLFSYGVIFPDADAKKGALWVLGAMTSADLDVKTGDITPANEPEILKALASFRLR
jgi:hypothetical protein